jgi:hypothetical protein
MPTMARLGEAREHGERREPPAALVALCLALTLGFTQGCARSQPRQPSDATSTASAQKLPFHADTDQASSSDGAPAAAASDPKQAASLPFRAVNHPLTLPAGTLLTVQLEDALSAAKVHAGDAFTASIAAPLPIDRDLLLEPGTPVVGRVESVRSQVRPGIFSGSGYFRLTLSSMTVAGRQIALQTSSLFARGAAQASEGVRVQKGRRLTFRLTAPVTLDAAKSIASRQSSTHPSE